MSTEKMRAIVQVPAFEEGERMFPVLDSIAAQSVPSEWRVDLEVWVTLSPPDRSLCDTWQTAVSASGFDVYEAPTGKLSARNAAHSSAVDRGADVIVTWDADSTPRDDAVLGALLKKHESGCVAVNGQPRVFPFEPTPLGALFDLGGTFEDNVKPHMHGQLSSFTADAWSAVGPFDDSIDQTDVDEVRSVEEFGFYRSLSQIGRVCEAFGAVVYNDTRRWKCRLGGGVDASYCDRRGLTTFFPRGNE